MAEKKINNRVYKFEPLVAWDAFDLLELLLDIVGPMTPVLEAIVADSGEERNVKLVRALAGALQSRDRAAIRKMIEVLLANTRCDGEPCVVGMKPTGLDEIIQVALWACEVQFSNFFDGGAVAGVWGKMQTAMKAD